MFIVFLSSVQDSCPARKLKEVSDRNKSDSKNVHQDNENEQPKTAVGFSIPSAAECYDCTIKKQAQSTGISTPYCGK